MNTAVRQIGGCEIFETYITPNEADLLQTILSVRRRIDQIAHKSAREDFFEYPEQPLIPVGIQNIQTYPHGYCREIRNSVLSSIQGLPYVRNFVAHGWQVLWAWRWFRDADTLIGSANIIEFWAPSASDELELKMIIDPATEEFGGENPAPVQVFYGPSDTYAPVSYASYYEINRHYWKQQLYPSIGIIGENLARFFPFISIDGAGRMSLRIGSQEAFLQSCEDLGRHTLEFYKSLKPADWIIPPEVLSSIQGTISEIKKDLLLGKDIRANTYSPISDASFLEFISNLEANLNPYYDGSWVRNISCWEPCSALDSMSLEDRKSLLATISVHVLTPFFRYHNRRCRRESS